MAKSTAAGGSPTNYNLRTAAGAHAAIVALHAHMTSVGMTLATFTGYYDPTGSSSQQSTTRGVASAWIAYNFSDADQATYPITIAFRFLYESTFSSALATITYRPQFRISEGINMSTGAALGRYVEFAGALYGGTPSATSVDTYGYYGIVSGGDFVRYSGDALTLIMCANGMYIPADGNTTSSMIDIHIERMRDATTGAVQAGFVGMALQNRIGNSGGHFPAFPGGASSGTNLPATFINLNTPLTPVIGNAHLRAGGPHCLLDGTTAMAAPIYYRDANGHFSTLKKLFTVPTTSIPAALATYTLDFSGAEVLYLAHRPASANGFTALANYSGETTLLYEWE